MFSILRKHLTYANVVMTLALVFAMTGGAYAAGKYLITSTKQISPKVLSSLKGHNGSNGVPGAAGPAGPAGPAGAKGETGPPGKEGPAGKGEKGEKGATGPQGSPWTDGGTLPEGATETGAWSAFTPGGGDTFSAISFPIPLASIPVFEQATNYIASKEPSTTQCPGTAAEPKAAPGNLCVYAGSDESHKVSLSIVISPGGEPGETGKTGVVLFFFAESEATFGAVGSWAVTAPKAG